MSDFYSVVSVVSSDGSSEVSETSTGGIWGAGGYGDARTEGAAVKVCLSAPISPNFLRGAPNAEPVEVLLLKRALLFFRQKAKKTQVRMMAITATPPTIAPITIRTKNTFLKC